MLVWLTLLCLVSPSSAWFPLSSAWFLPPLHSHWFLLLLLLRVAVLEAEKRGWWSYTDLAALWDATESSQVMMDASKQTAKVKKHMVFRISV